MSVLVGNHKDRVCRIASHFVSMGYTIRILHECQVWIDKSEGHILASRGSPSDAKL